MPSQSNHALITHATLSIIVCALACEAKPFIDFFKLKKNTQIHPFAVYQSASVVVMVSGMGQINMGAAVNWLSGYLPSKQTQFWINVGIAGHQSADIGTLFCTHKISHAQRNLYPTKWLNHKVALEQLNTINHAETAYKDSGLYDMEGFAFYQSAIRFNSQECVQCLKVVSDNRGQGIRRDKTFIAKLITQLIVKQCAAIVAFIEMHTRALNKLDCVANIFDSLQKQLLKHIHFSHSQRLQLTKLCQSAQSHQIDLNQLGLTKASQAKHVLARIKQHIDEYAVTL